MTLPAAIDERALLIHDLREAYMEVFPAPGIEEKLQVLAPHSYIAVTCSPTKGVQETLDVTQRLVRAGFRVVPHIAARNVRNLEHLREIMARLDALDVESIFVPGGDRKEPIGDYRSSLELLRAIAGFEHNISEIGIAAHPEGHPDVDDAALLGELLKKQPYAQYIVTQMCFDADILGGWLMDLRERGVQLPVWIGLPGAIERHRLLSASLRIGVGDSLRFLRRKPTVATHLMQSAAYQPDELVRALVHYQALPGANVAGYHLFCFNQVENTERWRNQAIEALR